MRVHARDFEPERFSFSDHPLLVVDEFWSADEMEAFRKAMRLAPWKSLHELPSVARLFKDCGNWLQGTIDDAERRVLEDRLAFPFVLEHLRSISGLARRSIGLSYFDYGAGDCLTLHEDTRSDRRDNSAQGEELRQIAITTYVHDRWEPDWGGELIVYNERRGATSEFVSAQCVLPVPGRLILFTVPRPHRVARIDAVAETHRRLSISGWFMTGSPASSGSHGEDTSKVSTS